MIGSSSGAPYPRAGNLEGFLAFSRLPWTHSLTSVMGIMVDLIKKNSCWRWSRRVDQGKSGRGLG